ncbi:hypothetical protein COOONC_17846 [Cooperia oncophora]
MPNVTRTSRLQKNASGASGEMPTLSPLMSTSTVCQDEAIDELANFLGVGEAVANVTRQAMNGNARFR